MSEDSRVFKRGFAPLPNSSPPLAREGDKGGGLINIKGVR